MVRIINISEYDNEILELQKAHFEARCRENILEHLIMNNQRDTVQFEKFWNEYVQYSIAYNAAKDKFSDDCVYKIVGKGFKGNWKIDFDKKELTIEDE